MRQTLSVRGHDADRVVHDHRCHPGASACRDDELLRAGCRDIPRGVDPGHAGATGPVRHDVAGGIHEMLALDQDAELLRDDDQVLLRQGRSRSDIVTPVSPIDPI